MMKRTEEIVSLIDKYLSKSLSPEELQRFETRLANNPELKKEVEKHSKLKEVLSDKDALLLKKKLINIGNTLKSEEKKVEKKPFIFNWKIAATIGLLIGLGSVVYFYFQKPSDLELYKDYFSVYPIDNVTRGNEENYFSKESIESYRSQKYSDFVDQLEKIQDIDTITDAQFYIYLGIGYLESTEENEAIKSFKKVDSQNTYYENAQWYLALAYLKISRRDSVKNILRTIIDRKGAYSNRASNLLNELE